MSALPPLTPQLADEARTIRLPEVDWRDPDYTGVLLDRIKRLERLRREPELVGALKVFYRTHPAQFIVDWGTTYDPRNQEIGLPATIPFILFPRQVEWIDWVMNHWQGRHRGVTVKSRDLGVSWLSVSLGCTLCLFHSGLSIGYGSRKLELVDHLGDPDSLFWKAREFIANVPREFRGRWTRDDAPEKRIMFPATGSIMKGEGGDEIGRGGRSSIYFVDEASKLPRPMLAEAALSQTTNCRIDIGTASGIGNLFHQHVTEWEPEHVFTFHWRDDPRKDDAWYAKQTSEQDPTVVAQEIDIDFAAAMEGVLIPTAWVQAAVDADQVLGLSPSGVRRGGFDVADEGKDKCAFVAVHGHTVLGAEEWSGKGIDIHASTQRTMGYCDEYGCEEFRYDADGVGADAKGAARVINGDRLREGRPRITAVRYFGSGSVTDPRGEDVKGRKNEDYFANLKAQQWWALRRAFYATWRAVTQGAPFDPDEIISIPRGIKNRARLVAELSQPTYTLNSAGKVVVDKAPEGSRSPNLADGLVMARAKIRRGVVVTQEAADRARVDAAHLAAQAARPLGARPGLAAAMRGVR